MKNLTYYVLVLLLPLTQISHAQIVIDTLAIKSVFIENAEGTGSSSTEETDTSLRYYFYPNLDAYFDIDTSEFVYKQEGKWIRNEYLSSSYRGYSAYNNYHVEILDYFGDTPFDNLAANRVSYPQDFKGRKAKLSNTLVVDAH